MGTTMSDKPISAGDLVIAVRATTCCAKFGRKAGVPFRVERIATFPTSCSQCGRIRNVPIASGDIGNVDLDRLKRIPPLEELEGEKRDEEITA